MVAPGVLFEEMGLKYFGPIDGHDLRRVFGRGDGMVSGQASTPSNGPLVARDGDIRRILLVTIAFNVFALPFISMIPVIGSERLNLSAGWIGATSFA